MRQKPDKKKPMYKAPKLSPDAQKYYEDAYERHRQESIERNKIERKHWSEV